MCFEESYLSKLNMVFEKLDLNSVSDRYLKELSSDTIIKKFKTVYEELTKASKSMNLTSILDIEGICEKHIFDSIIPFVLLNSKGLLNDGLKVVDVGTGAGFPSVPLSIISQFTDIIPHLTVTGIDSTKKKTDYVKYVSGKLLLSNLTVQNIRAEELSRTKARESFGLACARAVTEMRKLLELLSPLVSKGGIIVALKSHVEKEIGESENAASLLNLKLIENISYFLPSGDFRTVVVYKKINNTPEEYPRVYSKISSCPL